jgi:hypothetical protein
MLTEQSFTNGVNSIVDFIEHDSPLLAGLAFRNMVRDGASPVPLETTIKTILFTNHGPAVDRKMAVLKVGLSKITGPVPRPVRT